MLGNRFKIFQFLVFFIFVVANGQITINIVTTPVTCNGLSDGEADATVTITGGTLPLNYAWTTTNGSGLVASAEDQTVLSAGNYTLTVTDSSTPALTANKTISITEPTELMALAFQNKSVKCKGELNGEAKVTVSGGTTPYTYLWDKSASTSATASDLAAGIHTITITDANGCEKIATVTITEPNAVLSATASEDSPVKCKGGNDGVATINATGGTIPYTYIWDGNAPTSSATATDLKAGPHTVKIIDANGCEYSILFPINEPQNELLVSASQNSPVKCYGELNGSATVTVTGGALPYSYSWNRSTSISSTPSDLPAGVNIVTVIDGNGCEKTASVTITEPPILIVTINEDSSVKCNGGNDGAATVTVTGGTTPYAYSWGSSSTSITKTAIDLVGGVHTVTITDANGCIKTANITIKEPLILSATAVQVSQVKCKGDADGVAKVTPSGGTAPYTYSWDGNPFTASDTNNNLTAGVHTITIKDANGCTNPDPVDITINEPASELTGSITSNIPVKCKGDSNGQATVTASGGTAPYTYSWDGSSPINFATVTNLIAGSHTVSIIDANGCQKLISFTITEPNALSASAIEDNPVKCTGYFNGKATVTVYGGTPPYSYLWDYSTSKGPTASDLGAGLHKITIRDANNCETTTTVTINELISLTATTEQIQPVSCNGKSDGSAKVTPTGGTAPYLYSWDNAAFTSSFTANNLAAGTHTIIIRDANNCELTTTVLITEPPILSATAAPVSPVKCKGESNGSAIVTPTGGVAPYTFLWNYSTSTSATASNLMAGLHTITITDKNGCKAQTTVTITEPNALALTANIVPIICDKGGSITVQVTGGVSTNYFYTWTGPSSFAQSGANLRSVTNLLNGGTYKLTVTDDNGCAIVRYFTLEAYVPLQYTGPTAIEFDTCNSNPTFGINVVDIRGGIPYTDGNGNPYYYFEWFGPNNYHSNEAIIPIIPGNYVGIIIDSQNCRSAPINFTVTTPYTPIVVTETIGNVSCDATNNDGYIAVAINGGNIPYNIVWEREIPSTTTGNSNPTYSIIGQNILRVNNLMEGRYRLTVKSNLFGCSDSNPAYKFQTIYTVKTQNSIRILEAPVLDSSLCGGNKGTLTVKVIDDNNGPVSFYYNDELATANNLGGNEYLVYIDNFVTDGLLNIVNEFGCGETVIIDIKVAEPSFDISSVGYNLNGVININESVTFSNTSTQPYTRLEWDFGDNSDLSEEESPVHVYVVSGIRDVTLRIYNDLGCYKEYTEKISVGKGFLAMFPDIFTPNNDGINDYFQGELVGFESFEFEIYDLWNNLLFATATDVISNNNWGWDGYLSDGTVFNGKVFKYVFKGIDNFGKEIIVSNQAILLR